MTKDKTIQAHIIETGETAYAVAIDVSGFTIKGDEPVSFGGGGLGPAPYDLLTAALGECTAMTVRWYALQQKWPLEKVEVKLTHHKEGKQDVFEKTIIIYGDNLTEEQRKKLIEIAAKCPVQRTLEGTPIIKTEAL
jgi:putative redox protein